MKRTRLRQRSKTNSRPYENLKLRVSIVKQNPACEYALWFPEHVSEARSDDPHHLFGGTSGKFDFVWNVIASGRRTHDWCTEFATDGRILGLWIRQQTIGINEVEFEIASGKELRGWLSNAVPEHEWVSPYLEELRKAYPWNGVLLKFKRR